MFELVLPWFLENIVLRYASKLRQLPSHQRSSWKVHIKPQPLLLRALLHGRGVVVNRLFGIHVPRVTWRCRVLATELQIYSKASDNLINSA